MIMGRQIIWKRSPNTSFLSHHFSFQLRISSLSPSSFSLLSDSLPIAEEKRKMVAVSPSQKWGYVRIIAGTIAGGVMGFYTMHRVEISYKEKMNEELRKYQEELKKKKELEDHLNN